MSAEVLSVEGQLVGMPLAGPESFSQHQLNYLKRALGVDETVLWEGSLSTTSTTVTLAEATNNFEKIKVYVQSNGYNIQSTVIHELVLNYRSAFNNDAVAYVTSSEIHSSITTQCTLYLHFTGAFGTGFKLESGSKWVGSTLTENITSFPCIVTKIVGIHRIAGGN